MDGSNFQLMHTMLRVKDLDKSIDFYTRLLGMTLLRRDDFPGGQFTLAFLGYGPEKDTAVLELTYNWDNDDGYEIGTGYGHIAIGVRDIYAVCKGLEAAGANIPRQPGPMKHGKTHIAFIEDPDGYKVELIDLDTKTFA
ncbi:lactoylglutathione lyase [Acuticoccus sp. M5D2P5]|uniref:lactoylglutathione lyase n=1 Tax=Acuticoccus kalidii TaxID=2910977 RepID=UPI001F308C02|nr:lactoylglutathione lyase [Acuticoccus kalidii]MCF3934732.1 lactoylglutathione lyase [Acuticoccus kalidii]